MKLFGKLFGQGERKPDEGLLEFLERNKLTRLVSFAESAVQQLPKPAIQGAGVYLIWDPKIDQWVYVGEAESLRDRLLQHLSWQSYLFSNVGHALAHDLGRHALIPLLNKSWKKIKAHGLAGNDDVRNLECQIKDYVKDWSVTWILTNEREIGLRRFLEANLIAALSRLNRIDERWLGAGLSVCTCQRKLKNNADKIARSKLWNTDLVEGRETHGWMKCLANTSE
jgi:hypothetical protein